MSASRPPNQSGLLSRWTVGTLLAIVALVAYGQLTRFEDPVGEKYVPMMPPGAADFYYPFNGARALIMGVDPYRHDVRELFDPWGREEQFKVEGGITYRQYYPPSHMLLFVPLAWATHGDGRVAGRVWFHCNLAALVAISLFTCALAVPIVSPEEPRRVYALLFVPIAVALALNQGVALALERGQSDIFSALLCWAAVVLVLRRRFAFALFLATWATLLKGYPLLFTMGLFALGIDRAQWKKTVAGTAAATLVMLAPVAKYLPVAYVVTRYRSRIFFNIWLNHSFRNLAFNVAPEFADDGRIVLTAIGGVASALAWWRTWRTMHDADASDADRALWLALFASCSIGTVLGYSSLSYTYNLIMIFPGALVLVVGQARLAAMTLVRPSVIGAAVLVIVLSLFMCRLQSPTFSTSSVGSLSLMLFAAACAFVTLRRERDRAA